MQAAAVDRHVVRTLDTDDRALIAAHLKGLSVEDRVNRFCCATTDEIIEQYVDRIRYGRDIVLGVVTDGRLLGVVHAAVFDDRHQRIGEIGISVDSAQRKTGIGKRMLQATIDTAKALQVRRLIVLYRTGNRPMAALARSAGGRVECDGAESSAVFEGAAVQLGESSPAASG